VTTVAALEAVIKADRLVVGLRELRDIVGRLPEFGPGHELLLSCIGGDLDDLSQRLVDDLGFSTRPVTSPQPMDQVELEL